MRLSTLLVGATLAFTGCASGPPTSEARLDADVISRAEIDRETPGSCYVLVQNLRPAWLRWRGATSFSRETDVVIYMDEMRLGEGEELRNIHSSNVERIEFLDPRRATARFGVGHTQGAILVTTRR